MKVFLMLLWEEVTVLQISFDFFKMTTNVIYVI